MYVLASFLEKANGFVTVYDMMYLSFKKFF